MNSALPKETPGADGREALIFGICDRLYDHGHCYTNVVLAPVDADGVPDWENASPDRLEALEADEWPEDPQTAKRAAVLVDEIDGCDKATSMLIFLREDGQPSMQQVAGPDHDADIAMRIIGRDIGATPPAADPSPLQQATAKLMDDMQAAHEPVPAAANDNDPLARYLAAFSGPKTIMANGKIYNAVIESITGNISFVDGKAIFSGRGFSKTIDLPQSSGPRLVPSGDFVRGFQPPDYAIEGIAQRGFVYSLTASTGTGKTAIALLLSLLTAQGKELNGREVMQGRVVYFAGENPDDVAMRWIGICHDRGIDPASLDVHFITERFSIPNAIEAIRAQVKAIGGAGLIVVDTSAAYFQGDDENGNTALGGHARDLRALTTLPGRPCVIVPCHPTKNAQADALLPRGGGAFIAEMDGNLTLSRAGEAVRLHWQGKHRGPDFKPISFRLDTVNAPQLVDSRGRPVPTVMATPLTDGESAGPAASLLNAIKGRASSALEILHSLASDGEPVPMAVWREKCRAEFDTGAKTKGSLDQMFKRAKDELVAAGAVDIVDGGVRPVMPEN
ncbi:AAA family ATPase [Allorhizobium sp. NPDC080224]|uniref:AAA family ATPase n=1 Tax=Allorhizobium sp. NPDC080224 TaxID=3390547 RepID=UPI003D0188F0